MKLRVTFTFDERCRLALADHYGMKRPARTEDFRNWIDSLVNAAMEDVCADYDQAQQQEKENHDR
jgi:hypothetical protein